MPDSRLNLTTHTPTRFDILIRSLDDYNRGVEDWRVEWATRQCKPSSFFSFQAVKVTDNPYPRDPTNAQNSHDILLLPPALREQFRAVSYPGPRRSS